MHAIDQDLEVVSSRLLARADGRNKELREDNVSLHSAPKVQVAGNQMASQLLIKP